MLLRKSRFFDDGFRRFVQDNRNIYCDAYFKTVNYGGDGLVVSGMWLITGIYGYARKDTHVLNLSKSGVLGFFVSGGSTVVLKVIFGRARPYKNLGPKYFKPFNINDEFNSLPSGHTSVAFSVAGVIWRRTDNKLLRVSSLLLASSVALARIYLDRHWLSDVILGAGVGFAGGYISAGFVK